MGFSCVTNRTGLSIQTEETKQSKTFESNRLDSIVSCSIELHNIEYRESSIMKFNTG